MRLEMIELPNLLYAIIFFVVLSCQNVALNSEVFCFYNKHVHVICWCELNELPICKLISL